MLGKKETAAKHHKNPMDFDMTFSLPSEDMGQKQGLKGVATTTTRGPSHGWNHHPVVSMVTKETDQWGTRSSHLASCDDGNYLRMRADAAGGRRSTPASDANAPTFWLQWCPLAMMNLAVPVVCPCHVLPVYVEWTGTYWHLSKALKDESLHQSPETSHQLKKKSTSHPVTLSMAQLVSDRVTGRVTRRRDVETSVDAVGRCRWAAHLHQAPGLRQLPAPLRTFPPPGGAPGASMRERWRGRIEKQSENNRNSGPGSPGFVTLVGRVVGKLPVLGWGEWHLQICGCVAHLWIRDCPLWGV